MFELIVKVPNKTTKLYSLPSSLQIIQLQYLWFINELQGSVITSSLVIKSVVLRAKQTCSINNRLFINKQLAKQGSSQSTHN